MWTPFQSLKSATPVAAVCPCPPSPARATTPITSSNSPSMVAPDTHTPSWVPPTCARPCQTGPHWPLTPPHLLSLIPTHRRSHRASTALSRDRHPRHFYGLGGFRATATTSPL